MAPRTLLHTEPKTMVITTLILTFPMAFTAQFDATQFGVCTDLFPKFGRRLHARARHNTGLEQENPGNVSVGDLPRFT